MSAAAAFFTFRQKLGGGAQPASNTDRALSTPPTPISRTADMPCSRVWSEDGAIYVEASTCGPTTEQVDTAVAAVE